VLLDAEVHQRSPRIFANFGIGALGDGAVNDSDRDGAARKSGKKIGKV